MNPLIPNTCIRDVVLDAFGLAISFYRDYAANAGDTRQISRANIGIQEYASGIAMMDLLFDFDGETFLTPEATIIVVNSLMNFIQDIDKTKNPLLSYHIGNVTNQCRNAGCLTPDGDEVMTWAKVH